MVQNIVKHPVHLEAISKVHWADTNGPWYTAMVKTHMPGPSHIHMSVHTQRYINHICEKLQLSPLKDRLLASSVKYDKFRL